MATETKNNDAIFQRIDGLVYTLESEGYPFNEILFVMKDYLELCDEFLL